MSAILYLFVAEILSRKIKGNVNIEGFKHKNSDKEIKNIQHADDMTLSLINIEFVTHAINKSSVNMLGQK